MSGSFSEDEARRIFARAAERQHAVTARGPELSLAELQAIGREAGLDPEHVAAAVAELRAGPAPEPVVISGIDLTPRRSRVLPVEMTDALWEEMVGRLRRAFGAKGIPSEVGRIREWTSGPTSNLHFVAEPVEGGTRVTLETSRADEGRGINAGPLTAAVLAVFLTAFFAFGTFDSYVYIVPVVTLVFGAVLFWGLRTSLRRWSERRTTEFDALMDQFELMARAAPVLDLDPLPDPEDLGERPVSRSRTR